MTTGTTDRQEHLIVLLAGDDADKDLLIEKFEQLSAESSGHTLKICDSLNELLLSDQRDYANDNAANANHGVVVVSRTSATSTNQEVIDAALWCRDNFVPLFFVCDTTSQRFDEQAPKILQRFNGLLYDNPSKLTEIANQILHLIGYDENERSVFISYRRSDASAIAGDLRYAMQDRGWDVFLDRFNIPPAVDFQVHLDRDLDGRSLVLVIESPDITGSQWVEHEIAFARARGIGLHALTLPETASDQMVPAIDDDRRSRVKHSRFEERHGLQTPVGLVEILATLQRVHTLALRARRTAMLEDVTTILARAGYHTEPVGEWAVSGIRHGSRRVVVLATPRMPRPGDLRVVQQLRGRRGQRSDCDAWVVHPLVDPESHSMRLLRWLCHDRRIRICAMGSLQKEIRS